MRAYLASPLGFAESTRAYMEALETALAAVVEVVNPWRTADFEEAMHSAGAIADYESRVAAFAAVNRQIGAHNEQSIRSCEMVIAVLDGVDVDSGTASEIGFAYALGKRIHGLRTDRRVTGDNIGATVNLQVEYFIEASGGQIVTDLAALLALFTTE